MKTLLKNVRAVQPDRIVDDAQILVDGDRIEAVNSSTGSNAERTIDLNGETIFPGFIDVHIHGAVGIDTLEADHEDLQRVSTFLAGKGVTGWMSTLVPGRVDEYKRAIHGMHEAIRSQRERVVGARVLGVHYEGPFVNSSQCGALHVEYFRTYRNDSDLSELPTVPDENAVHMMTLAPEVEGAIELVSVLKSKGWVASLGHTRASLELLNAALAAGAQHMTHFMNAMSPLHHREPGPIAWGLARDEVTIDIIADGIHLDPYILNLLVKVKGASGISLISDAIAAAGKGDGNYQIWGETINVSNGRTSNKHGSIAGSVITMLDAVRMMRSLGVSDVDVARMASLNPARLLRIDTECGSLEEGKHADLVAVDTEGNVTLTMIGGEIVFQVS